MDKESYFADFIGDVGLLKHSIGGRQSVLFRGPKNTVQRYLNDIRKGRITSQQELFQKIYDENHDASILKALEINT